MNISEILNLESFRQEQSQWNIIHFVKEGNFYHAHDWSAWLMSKYPFGESVNNPLKVIAKKMKDETIDAFVGFPAKSIEKYIPNDGSVTFLPVDDNRVDVIIPMPSDFYEKSLEELIAMKDEWKESLPIIESKKKKREEREIQQQVPQFMRISDIYRYIVALPIDELSPRDALDTLRDVRKRLIALF